MTDPTLSKSELVRYARHLALPNVGISGQLQLRASKVLCVGAGGLGSPLAMYLAAAGVGTVGIVDDDVVDSTNLQRQLLHGTSDVGRPKVDSARDRLAEVNPLVSVTTYATRLTSANALDLLSGYDVVVDGTDNFPTRYLVNDACVLLRKPNVYGSIFRWEGQVSVFGTSGGPCYRCLFREPPPPGLVPNCAEGGVLGVLPGIVGAMQAMETVKLLLGVGESLAGRLLIFDALDMTWREVAVQRNPECPVCGDRPTQEGLIDYDVFCGIEPAGGGVGRGAVQEVDVREARTRLSSDRPPFLLDVREAWEWSVGNLGPLGAHHLPLGDMDRRMDEIPRDRPVLVYCRTGIRSETAVRRLLESGYKEVAHIEGGIVAWSRTVDPSVVVA
jgi:molybdopterin/thiamine biosynthesis adenylyltransferase/rhodanese-related sulfurtransferase